MANARKILIVDDDTDLRDALSGEDSETITAKTNDLMQAAMKIGETIEL